MNQQKRKIPLLHTSGDTHGSDNIFYIIPMKRSTRKLINKIYTSPPKRKCLYIHCNKWISTKSKSNFCGGIHAESHRKREKRISTGKPLKWSHRMITTL